MTTFTVAGVTCTETAWTAPGNSITATCPSSSSPGNQSAVVYSTTPLVTNGTGAFTLANGNVTNTSAYNDIQYMGQIVCTNANCAPVSVCSPLGSGAGQCANHSLSGAAQPDHFVILNVVASMNYGNQGENSLFAFGEQGTETNTNQLCTHVHLRQDAALGDWSSPLAGANGVNNGFQLGCIYDSLTDSAVTQTLYPSKETHAVGAGWGSQHRVNHNYFYCCSSGTFAGGSGSTTSLTTPSQYVINTDGEYRQNVMRYPYFFVGYGEVPGYNNGGNFFWPNNFSLYRKNCFEQKSGLRLLIDGNDCGATDVSGGQFGASVSLGTRNQSTGFGGQNYWTQMSDVTFTNNRISDVCYGPDSANSATNSGGGGTAYKVQRTNYSNLLFYGIQTNVPACVGGDQSNFKPDENYQQWQGNVTCTAGSCTFVGNCNADIGNQTIGTSTATVSPLSFPSQCPGQVNSISWTSGSACTAGSLSFSSSGVNGAIAAGASFTCSGASIASVTLNSSGSAYPSAPTITIGSGTCTGCTFTAAIATSPLTPIAGVEVADINAGDPVVITQCTTLTSLNAPLTVTNGFYWPSGVAPRAWAGSTPWNGTSFSSANLTVSWPSAVTGTDSSNYCTLSNIQGGPLSLQMRHWTFISGGTYGINADSNQANKNGPQFMIDPDIRDNILLNNGHCVGNAELGTGTVPQTFWTDYTTANWAYNVCPGSTQSAFTEFDNNPAGPTASPCSLATGCTTTTTPAISTFYFPASVSTIDFVSSAANSGTLTLPDYHGYELTCPDSPFCAAAPFISGTSGPASDGTSMGANIPAIDAAFILNQYNSSSYPDVPVNVSGTTLQGVKLNGVNVVP
jgi:hypothetical protein